MKTLEKIAENLQLCVADVNKRRIERRYDKKKSRAKIQPCSYKEEWTITFNTIFLFEVQVCNCFYAVSSIKCREALHLLKNRKNKTSHCTRTVRRDGTSGQ